MATNNLQRATQTVPEVRALLNTMKDQFQMALANSIPVDRFLRVAMTSIAKTPKLLECTQQSLLAALIESAQLGLEPDGVLGHAYLIPRWNSRKKVTECNFQPGYKGLMDLCYRSGQVLYIDAKIVYEKEHFEYEEGINPRLVHRPMLTGTKDQAIAIYARAKLKNGECPFVVMSTDDVEAVRQTSQSKDKGPWVTNWEEMAKKTAIIRLAKYLPKSKDSVELQRAVSLAELDDAGITQELTIIDTTLVEDEAPSSGLKALTKEKAKKTKKESTTMTMTAEEVAEELKRLQISSDAMGLFCGGSDPGTWKDDGYKQALEMLAALRTGGTTVDDVNAKAKAELSDDDAAAPA